MSSFDVCIIGGGIHGAGVARRAVELGYSCCLIEQESEAGYWTSSRSSKLIHGGLRYLEGFHFSLVKECLAERDALLTMYPDLVEELEILIPVYRTSSRGSLKIRLGLWLYDFLAAKSTLAKSGKVPSSRIKFRKDELVDAYSYFDARCRDKELCKNVISDCVEKGLILKLNSEVTQIRFIEDGFHTSFQNGSNGGSEIIQSSKLINAAGPWVNILASKISPEPKTIPIELIQGTHLVLDLKPDGHGYYLESPIDQRPIFVLPFSYKGEERTLLGTTEKLFLDDPKMTSPSQEETSYLLDSYNKLLPSNMNIRPDQILTSFAGLRVLPKSGSNISRRSRETCILRDFNEKYCAIYGGKYTSFLSTGRKVLGCKE